MWAVLETWKVRDVSIEPQLVPEVAQHQLEMVVIGWVHCSGSRLLEGAALWRCSEVLELVASKWLPVAREWSLWWLLLHLPWEQMSRPPWSLGGIRQELPCGDPRFCWEMFYYGYLTCVLPIKCQLVLNDLQAKKPKGFLRWPPAIGRSAFQISSWGRLSTPP